MSRIDDVFQKLLSHKHFNMVCNGLTHWGRDKNVRLFADDTFKRIFLNENVRISINISLKFVPKGLINNIPALVLMMAWRRPGDKPLSEPMVARSPTHMCVTRPQWVNMVCNGLTLSGLLMHICFRSRVLAWLSNGSGCLPKVAVSSDNGMAPSRW